MIHTRRTWLKRTAVGAAITALPCSASGAVERTATSADERRRGVDLRGLFGVTTGSFMRHLSIDARPGKLRLLDLPQIMCDELDLPVIDLMTRTLASLDADYCDKFRTAAERAGRTITNLKMNLEQVDLASADDELRRRSLAEYKQTLDVAARLGCRWARPATTSNPQDIARLVAALDELADYAEPKGISLLIENNGWIRSDPAALPTIVERLRGRVAVQPDTGNWTNEKRWDGLARAFQHAVTCDFKATNLGPDGEHEAYDLRRCFDVAWKAGFRGPWCFEMFHDDLPRLFRSMVKMREMLTAWTAEKLG